MEYKDYYRVLGVPKTANAKEIRSAYRKLALAHHPDVNQQDPKAEERIKEINEAYEVLGDAEKRKKYDQLGSNWQAYEQWQRSGGQPGVEFDLSNLFFGGTAGRGRGRPRSGARVEDLNDVFGHSDFFRTFFGEAAAGGGPRPTGRTTTPPGEDVEHTIEITLEEAFHGTTRLLALTNADGSQRRLEVKLPAGVTDGRRINYAKQGAPSPYGGPSGDLIVKVAILPHERFTRSGDDLTTRLAVPLTTCLLGGEVEVATLAGPRLLRIPPETADGRRIRLKGQGMPHLRRTGEGAGADRGDLIVEVHALLPRNLTTRQRELIEELARLEESQHGTSAAD